MLQTLLDQVPGWLVLIGTVLLFAAATAGGIRFASWRRRSVDDDHKAHAGVLLGALLALLGLSLAFSFRIAESRFVERRQLVLQEAKAIGSAYLRASFLPQPHRDNTEKLLRRYVELRIVESPEKLPGAIERSEELHRQLWAEAPPARGSSRARRGRGPHSWPRWRGCPYRSPVSPRRGWRRSRGERHRTYLDSRCAGLVVRVADRGIG